VEVGNKKASRHRERKVSLAGGKEHAPRDRLGHYGTERAEEKRKKKKARVRRGPPAEEGTRKEYSKEKKGSEWGVITLGDRKERGNVREVRAEMEKGSVVGRFHS